MFTQNKHLVDFACFLEKMYPLDSKSLRMPSENIKKNICALETVKLSDNVALQLIPEMQATLPFVVSPQVFFYYSLDGVIKFHPEIQDTLLLFELQDSFIATYNVELTRTRNIIYRNIATISNDFSPSTQEDEFYFSRLQNVSDNNSLTRKDVAWFNKISSSYKIGLSVNDYKLHLKSARIKINNEFKNDIKNYFFQKN
ncbi:hypothetical protein K9M74_03860 [Candidatus Woesearchaeota archaeon]|nr:hypothetical protein [Candidatus Woesearchaeota archaeon]